MPDSKLVIRKGTPVVISLIGMHRDAENFPDPLSYQPERYLDESQSFKQAAYMPFGEGPRHCIGGSNNSCFPFFFFNKFISFLQEPEWGK